ncbi:MAG: NUDIX hydrolase, partial [Pseudomonadota bacterium]
MSESKDRLRGPITRRIPDGDDRERLVCNDCGFINYENPKIVVGSVATWGDQILLCKRAIEPRLGFWTLPAGYMELGENPADGAKR